MAAVPLIVMTTAIMLQSVSGAPLISTDNTQDTNLIMDEGAGKMPHKKFQMVSLKET